MKAKSIMAIVIGVLAFATCAAGIAKDQTKLTVNAAEIKSEQTCIGGHERSEGWSSDETMHWHECSICGKNYEKVIGVPDAVLEHTPGPAATYTTPQTCTVCGRVLKEALGNASEQYTGNNSVNAENETEGEETSKQDNLEEVSIMGSVFDDTICPICGEPYEFGSCTKELRDADSCLYYCYCFNSTSQSGHGHAGYYKVHSQVEVEEIAAEEGYCPDRQVTCVVCGDTTVESTHELLTTTTATCLESGVRTEKCAKCAYTYSEEESPFGHSYTCIYERLPAEGVPGEQIYECDRCGWMYGKTTMPSSLQHEEIPQWIPIVMIAEGVVILLGIVALIVIGCAKKKENQKCNGGKSS